LRFRRQLRYLYHRIVVTAESLVADGPRRAAGCCEYIAESGGGVAGSVTDLDEEDVEAVG
jgi:hypothetical protein